MVRKRYLCLSEKHTCMYVLCRGLVDGSSGIHVCTCNATPRRLENLHECGFWVFMRTVPMFVHIYMWRYIRVEAVIDRRLRRRRCVRPFCAAGATVRPVRRRRRPASSGTPLRFRPASPLRTMVPGIPSRIPFLAIFTFWVLETNGSLFGNTDVLCTNF